MGGSEGKGGGECCVWEGGGGGGGEVWGSEGGVGGEGVGGDGVGWCVTGARCVWGASAVCDGGAGWVAWSRGG